MKARSKLGLITLLGVIALGALLVLRQGPNQNASVAATSTASATSTSATLQSIPTATPAPAAAPTMTAAERQAMEYVKNLGPKSEVSSPDQCSTVLQTQPWCHITHYAKRITRPEWDELFPQTQFFLVPYTLIAQESQQSQHVLVIEQNGRHYDTTTFDRLLDANDIVITDTNRELVAKAFALMTIPGYLLEEVNFLEWKAGDWQTRHNYDHYLKTWTKIQGLEIWWWFDFENDNLKFVTRSDVRPHVGNYIDVPSQILPFPPSIDYNFYHR